MSNETNKPPKLALAFFRWYCRPDRLEELEGDILELYDIRRAARQPAWQVDLRFWWDVIRCFKSYSRKSRYFMDTSGALYKSYAKLAFRQMIKNKGPIAVNVLGLGLALGFCITVYMIYAYNWEFDSVYEAENMYRIHGLKEENGELRHYESTPLPLEQALESELAAVEDVISVHSTRAVFKKGDQYFTDYFSFASPGFLDHFDIPLKYGHNEGLNNTNAVYLNEPAADKLFGEGVSPIGEEVTVYLNNNAKLELTVVGVFNTIQLNSSFLFNGLVSSELLISAYDIDRNDWSEEMNFAQFVKLSNAESKEDVEKHLQTYLPRQNEAREQWKLAEFQLIDFHDPMINDEVLWSRHTNARLRFSAIMIFTVMAVLILFIACFNMANTTMALISKRVKEIGVRKTLGSFNHQIFTQFIFEMLITMALAFVVALAMTNILAKEIWGLFDVRFFLEDIDITGVAAFVALFLLFCTLITGLFPALYAWKFQPVSILNHKQSLKGVGLLHKMLTVAQYSFSIAVLVTGLAFTKNVDFLKEMDYGYRINDVLILEVDDINEFTSLKDQLDDLPFVESSFGSVHHLGGLSSREILEIDTAKNELESMIVGHETLQQMGVQLLEGRHFIEGSENDVSNHLIVNERFASLFFPGEDVLNQVVKIGGERKTVIGVINNYMNGEVFEDYKPEPVIYNMVPPAEYKKLIVKVMGKEQKEVEQAISSIWASTIDRPFMRRWQDDVAHGDSMRATHQIKTLFIWLAGLGCILSLIGILSLASLNVAKKTKEISIRKVLGASLKQILISINKPFYRILTLSLVLGVTMGWLVAEGILSTIYLYYLDLSPLTGIPVGLFIVGAAVIMTSIAVIKAAMASPTDGLRTE